jgi:hypothetical protein
MPSVRHRVNITTIVVSKARIQVIDEHVVCQYKHNHQEAGSEKSSEDL